MRLEPKAIVDRYEVEALLGEGGMAAVYRVRHQQLGTPHALKVLKLVHEDVRVRLLQEGRVQASLRHPNIVNVTDVVDVGGVPGLVMEFVEGASLDNLLRDEKPSMRQADHLIRGILAGVGAAHRAGLIHRDLKPANILLAVDHRDQLTPKITDFGLAKVLDDAKKPEATMPGVGFGTPAYMAPEQMRNAAAVDHRADIFSLGVILYEVMTGQRCFPGDDVLDVLVRVSEARYQPVTELAPDLPPHIVEAIERSLRKDPDERWPDVDALLACWRQEESDFDAVWTHETSLRMKTLGKGVDLQSMPAADGPTDIRNPTPEPSRPRSEIDTVDLQSPDEERSGSASRAGIHRPATLLLGLGFSTVASVTVGVLLAVAVLALSGWWLWRAPGPPLEVGTLASAADPPLPVPPPAPVAPEPLQVTPPFVTPVSIAQEDPEPALRQRVAPSPRTPPGPVARTSPAARPAPAPRPTPAAKPEPEPVAPEPSPAPIVAPASAAQRYGSVFITSDVEAYLVASDGSRREAGSLVLPDDYTVEAVFPMTGLTRTKVRFKLAPGDIIQVHCDAAFEECRRP
ncbi:MAG: serine/threonine protein kinase [Myxococcales bacterium]|nr:serine/threonine protein kinase [Myxococcales bacterium]